MQEGLRALSRELMGKDIAVAASLRRCACIRWEPRMARAPTYQMYYCSSSTRCCGVREKGQQRCAARQTYCIPAPKVRLHLPAPETRRRCGTLLKQQITNTDTPLNLYRASAPGPRSSPSTVRRPVAVATETRNELRALGKPEGGSLGTSLGLIKRPRGCSRSCSSYAPSPVV